MKHISALAFHGGLEGEPYIWGDALEPEGRPLDYWQGIFPYENTSPDGHNRTSPVGR